MTPSHKIRDYVFEEKIAEGGMGARHALPYKPVAIKVLSDQLLTSLEFKGRFLREARAQACLYHPDMAQAIDYFQKNGMYYLVRVLVEGESSERHMCDALGLAQAVCSTRFERR